MMDPPKARPMEGHGVIMRLTKRGGTQFRETRVGRLRNVFKSETDRAFKGEGFKKGGRGNISRGESP